MNKYSEICNMNSETAKNYIGINRPDPQKKGEERVMTLYFLDTIMDNIEWSWEDWTSQTTTQFLINELEQGKPNKIVLVINSFGGSVQAANTFRNILKQYQEKNNAIIESHTIGYAASAATIIALIPPKGNRFIGEGSYFYIHNPYGSIFDSEAYEIQAYAEMLTTVKNDIATLYKQETNLSIEEAKIAMDKSTWYNTSQAIEFGFADKKLYGQQSTTSIPSNVMASLKNVPKEINHQENAMETLLKGFADIKDHISKAFNVKTPIPQPQETPLNMNEEIQLSINTAISEAINQHLGNINSEIQTIKEGFAKIKEEIEAQDAQAKKAESEPKNEMSQETVKDIIKEFTEPLKEAFNALQSDIAKSAANPTTPKNEANKSKFDNIKAQ